MADPLGKLVHLTSLDLCGTWHGVCCVCVCMACRVRVCVDGCGSVKLGDRRGRVRCVCVWAPGNELGAEGAAAALTRPLGKLVRLTSLNLGGTWHGGVGVCCVCVCTSECAWAAVAE